MAWIVSARPGEQRRGKGGGGPPPPQVVQSDAFPLQTCDSASPVDSFKVDIFFPPNHTGWTMRAAAAAAAAATPALAALALLLCWLLAAVNRTAPEPYMVRGRDALRRVFAPRLTVSIPARTRFSTSRRPKSTARAATVRGRQRKTFGGRYAHAFGACRRVGPQDHDVPGTVRGVHAVRQGGGAAAARRVLLRARAAQRERAVRAGQRGAVRSAEVPRGAAGPQRAAARAAGRRLPAARLLCVPVLHGRRGDVLCAAHGAARGEGGPAAVPAGERELHAQRVGEIDECLQLGGLWPADELRCRVEWRGGGAVSPDKYCLGRLRRWHRRGEMRGAGTLQVHLRVRGVCAVLLERDAL
ncbi:unnamed protein product [Phytophthora fragariaefolia]|uniref:Unnamed protein product n=1 Tax=Phytophthora fragariaefolia TaxID=1490495 RepID=A0A9W6XN55_9STRA|nr:unnamed protein product [Phytophthora fragariaefolia]